MTFDALFVPDEICASVADGAWLQAMLDFERALSAAEASAGVIPAEAAAAIGEACTAERFDIRALAAAGHAVGNPAEPLVRALRKEVGGQAAGYAHWGATSQDVTDTAAMLVSRRALSLVVRELDGVAGLCADLAGEHRGTVMAARTILQQAVPTTFGARAAGWLVSLVEARRRLVEIRDERLAVELGGAGGTLAALGDRGLEVLRRLSEELELAEPVVPWHASRVRIAELASALDVAAGALAKIGVDVALLAQTEIGEVREPPGSGGSSTMPHKRNPIGSALAVASAAQVHGAASVLSGAPGNELERGLGGWQAEWGPLSQALALTGGAAAAIREVLSGLEIDAERMRANLAELTAAEHASFLLSERVGRAQAHELVGEAARSKSFREGLVGAGLTADEVDRALDPEQYLGATDAFVDRALAFYDRERG